MLDSKQDKKANGTGSPMGKLYKLNCDVVNSSVDRATVATEREGEKAVARMIYDIIYGKKPNLFGCTLYVHIPDGDCKKLDKKAQKLRFIGYTETAGNYKV